MAEQSDGTEPDKTERLFTQDDLNRILTKEAARQARKLRREHDAHVDELHKKLEAAIAERDRLATALKKVLGRE